MNRRDALKAIAALPLVASGAVEMAPAPITELQMDFVIDGTKTLIGKGCCQHALGNVESVAGDSARVELVCYHNGAWVRTGQYVDASFDDLEVKPGNRCGVWRMALGTTECESKPWSIISVECA